MRRMMKQSPVFGGIVVGIVLFVTMLIGWVWRRGAKAKAELAAKYPAPGKLVDVGGYRLHITKSGHYIQLDRPELVIEAIREVVEAAQRLDAHF